MRLAPPSICRLAGALAALAAYVVDQGSKLWLLDVYRIDLRQPVRLAPGLDVVLAWNQGISYSLFSAGTNVRRWTLLVATLAIVAALAIWMWRSRRVINALGLGFIIGGALGNATDRWAHGAVADFFYFHVGSFSWYVFNLADCAIVLGVCLLACESFLGAEPPPKH